MIWVNISNILYETKFSGIARTEYELCLYAYRLYQKGYDIGFVAYDERMGFNRLEYQTINHVLSQLKQGIFVKKTKPTRKQKLKRSISKRINSLKLLFGHVTHCFNHDDVIISVGQKLGTSEMKSLMLIKKRINIQFKLLCHDLIPLNYPQFFFQKNSHLFSQYIQYAVRVVDQFYCNSEFTKKELIDYCQKNHIQPPPMHTVTLGCDLYTKKALGKSNPFIQEIIKTPYVLFVSTIEVRKNHQLIYDMYLQLIEQGYDNLPTMCFVGKRGWKVDALLKNLDNDTRVQDKIIIADNISDANLILLYQKCWFTVYPSFIEGYGLPIAESLSFGKYCLSSNAGSLPEAGGNFVDYLNPNDIESWVDKFAFLITHPEYITTKEKYIQDNYQPVAWESFAKSILKHDIDKLTAT